MRHDLVYIARVRHTLINPLFAPEKDVLGFGNASKQMTNYCTSPLFDFRTHLRVNNSGKLSTSEVQGHI